MNRRIRKKRNILKSKNMSKWKYLRISERTLQNVSTETQHSINRIVENGYNRNLSQRRHYRRPYKELIYKYMTSKLDKLIQDMYNV